MAKLSGVNVVAESIVYNGAAYVKTAEQAQAGDIVRMNESGYDRYLPQGAFFEVVVTQDDGDIGIIDEEGDDITVDDDFTVFRRVTAETAAIPTKLPDTYVIHDGKVYVKESRKAEVGDKVIVVAKTAGAYSNGDIGVLEWRNSLGGTAKRDSGESMTMYDSEYNVLVPTDTVTIDGAEYTLKKREADVGEITLTIEKFPYGDAGDIATVTKSPGICDDVVTDKHELMNNSRYLVLVPKQPAAPPRLKVGDYAKVVRHGGSHNYEIGDIVEVTGLSVGTLFHGQVVSTGRYGNCLSTKQTVRATDEEVAEAKRKSIKVGDYVRITQGQGNWPAGTIVKVTDASVTGYGSTSVICATDGKNTYVSSQFEPVTPAEADAIRQEAEAAHKQAEEAAKWDAIGRKVGEFKTGDIVRYQGEIATVEDVGGMLLGIRRQNGSYVGPRKTDVTLVAPVESLFNAN